jgi:hypothetical protein
MSGERSVGPLVGHICDGGWTTVKCCNLCGMPMIGESWEIPFVTAVRNLEKQWAREIANRNNIFWSELDQARGYELRERHLALREIVENYLPTASDPRCSPEAGR